MNKFKGTLIAVEGLDGVGKSSTEKLTKHDLSKQGQNVILVHAPFVRYPNGKPYKRGQEMYKKIQSPNFKAQGKSASKLFAQNTKELEHKIVIPALRKGKTVIQDRYYGSTLAYQGKYVKRNGHYKDKNHTMSELKKVLGKDFVKPDANIYLYLDDKDEVDRITGRAVGKTHKVDKYDRKVAQKSQDGHYHELDHMKKKYDIANHIMRKQGVPIKKINAQYQPEQRSAKLETIISAVQTQKVIRDLKRELTKKSKEYIQYQNQHPKTTHALRNYRQAHPVLSVQVGQHQQTKQPTKQAQKHVSRQQKGFSRN